LPSELLIRSFRPDDESEVIGLWRRCGLTRPQNNPKLDIERKMKVQPDLFLVGLIEGEIVTTVMGGYEGHRGWINYLGVDPRFQKTGLGRKMMDTIQKKLSVLDCPKINLQVREDNLEVVKFYKAIGYTQDPVLSMGKRLVKD
jgi:ribosomal protein S18 acetylase RimI-like enzyme